jgi:hypothetical protein
MLSLKKSPKCSQRTYLASIDAAVGDYLGLRLPLPMTAVSRGMEKLEGKSVPNEAARVVVKIDVTIQKVSPRWVS